MKSAQAHRSGFSLVELLVALAISVLLAALLLTVMRGALELWTRSTGRLGVVMQANVILDRLQADLENALVRDDDAVWLAATVLADTSLSGWWSDGLRAKPTGAASLQLAGDATEDCRFGVAGVWLRLFVAASDDGDAAARAVGYQLVRRELAAGAGDAAYLLHRAEVSADNTFAAGYDLDPLSGGYRTRSGTPGHAGNLIRPPLGSVLGDHIVDFGVRLYQIDGDTLRLLFPHDGESEFLSRGNAELLAFAEVMVRVLDETGVRRLAAFEEGWEAGEPENDWWAIVEEHSHVVVRRIALPAFEP